MSDLHEEVKTIKTREDLASFIQVLHDEFQAHHAEWENVTLETYLEALSGYVWDRDGNYINRNQSVPEQPDWSLIGAILLAGFTYE
jgi:hypothetical protein